jgi:hypothetical protein
MDISIDGRAAERITFEVAKLVPSAVLDLTIFKVMVAVSPLRT